MVQKYDSKVDFIMVRSTKNNKTPHKKKHNQVVLCDLFGMVKRPFGKVVGDLQRLGMKRSRLESPGIFTMLRIQTRP